MKFKTEVSRPSLKRLTVEQFLTSGKRFVAGDIITYPNGKNPTIHPNGTSITLQLGDLARWSLSNHINESLLIKSAKACNDEFTAMNLLNRWQACPAVNSVGRYFEGVSCKDYADLLHELTITPEERAEIEAAKVSVVQEWEKGGICYHPSFSFELSFLGPDCFIPNIAVIQYQHQLLVKTDKVYFDELNRKPSPELAKSQRIDTLMTLHTHEQLAEMIYQIEQAK